MIAGRFSRTAADAPAPIVPARAQGTLPRILCVDDDERLLAGLSLRLRRTFEVVTATSAVAGLATLDLSNPFAVVVSDMRMPKNDGASFLSAMRRVAPDTTRVLLTGEADVTSAIAAVNDGEVFRFLTKPIETPVLVEALNAAVARHQEVAQQCHLVDDMAQGASRLLALALANHAAALGTEGERIRRLVSALTRAVYPAQTWSAEMAVNVFHVATIALPAELAERWKLRAPISTTERHLVNRVLQRCIDALGGSSGMREVSEALTVLMVPEADEWPQRTPSGASVPARVLYLILQVDAANSRGENIPELVRKLRLGAPDADVSLINALNIAAFQAPYRKSLLSEVTVGQRIVKEVRLPNGLLFLPAAHVVGESTITKIQALDVAGQNTVVYTLPR